LGVERIAYLDQRVATLDDAETVLENLRRCTPRTPETERRIKLGRFLFGGDAALKRAGELSGGERMRAGLACALLADEPPELLLLDEPGNHLDRDSLEQLEGALSCFEGAFIVVTHDRSLREAIGCDTVWALSRAGLEASWGSL
jgi:ATPase subunit of ABC transporter with duplicated ATPase domains